MILLVTSIKEVYSLFTSTYIYFIYTLESLIDVIITSLIAVLFVPLIWLGDGNYKFHRDILDPLSKIKTLLIKKLF